MDPTRFCLANHLYGDASPTLRFCKFCRKAMCEICYDYHIKTVNNGCSNEDTTILYTGVSSSGIKDNVVPQDINMVPPQSLSDDSLQLINGKQLPGQSDKHSYKQCTAHSLIMDQFCYEHFRVICQQCWCENHQGCLVKHVEHVCLELDNTTVSQLRNSLNKIRVDAIEVKTFLSRNVTELEKQKQTMLKKVKKEREDVLKEINRKYEETVSEIKGQHEKFTSELCAYVCNINSVLDGIDLCLKDSRPLECRQMEVGIFLKYQDILSSNSQIPNDLKNLYNRIRKIKISFKENKRFQPLMEKSTLGNINVTTTKYTSLNPHQEINCPLFVSQPVVIRKDNSVAAANRLYRKDVHNESGHSEDNDTYQCMKAFKDSDLNVRFDSESFIVIRGLTVFRDGRLIMADLFNREIKMLTSDRQMLSQLQLNEICNAITVYNDTTVIASGGENLFFIDISEGSLSLRKTVRLDYGIFGIQTCDSNLLVTCREEECVPSVKLITTAGKPFWSVSIDQRGYDLFLRPSHITCYRDQSKCRVVVTDWRRDCITVLDGDTGDVIKVIELEGKGPKGVISDNNGNFYICYWRSGEIVIWNKDMTSSRVLCTTRPSPWALGYDSSRNQLIVSYEFSQEVEWYQLE